MGTIFLSAARIKLAESPPAISPLNCATTAAASPGTPLPSSFAFADPLLLLFLLQGISLTGRLSGLPRSYGEDVAGAFAWATLDVRPPAWGRGLATREPCLQVRARTRRIWFETDEFGAAMPRRIRRSRQFKPSPRARKPLAIPGKGYRDRIVQPANCSPGNIEPEGM